jgi:hypothetical protein
MLIHLVFTFGKTFGPIISTIFANLENSRWSFGELKKYPYNILRRIPSNSETVGIVKKFRIARLVLCAIEWIPME